MWVAVQPVQIALRTLVTDGCSYSEQRKANAWAGTYINLAAVMANLAAFMDLLPHTRSVDESSNSLFQGLSLLAIVVLTITIVISCVSVGEKSPNAAMYDPTARVSLALTLRILWNIVVGRSSQIRAVYLVQFFAWLGWFPFVYYAVTYDLRTLLSLSLNCLLFLILISQLDMLRPYVGILMAPASPFHSC